MNLDEELSQKLNQFQYNEPPYASDCSLTDRLIKTIELRTLDYMELGTSPVAGVSTK
jgi:hypothetical protein